MPKKYIKAIPIISFAQFIEQAEKVQLFTSSNGKRYSVQQIENNEMYFLRLDAKAGKIWNMNLKEVYRAYKELENFATVNFKPFVPITHSPARGLLLHLGMLTAS